ncbi:RNA-binding S4 domain-containing protein [Paracoccaceae bacterium GXU_MW_L88]
MRADKWLYVARFFKTRALAKSLIEGGKFRVDGNKTHKPGYTLRAGQVLTFPQAGRIRVIRVCGFAERRGSATEAQSLYHDETPPPPLAEPRGPA